MSISNTSKNLNTIRKSANFPNFFFNALLYLDYTAECTEGKGIPLTWVGVPSLGTLMFRVLLHQGRQHFFHTLIKETVGSLSAQGFKQWDCSVATVTLLQCVVKLQWNDTFIQWSWHFPLLPHNTEEQLSSEYPITKGNSLQFWEALIKKKKKKTKWGKNLTSDIFIRKCF